MSPERALFINRLEARNYSPSTIKNYAMAMVKITQFYKKSPFKLEPVLGVFPLDRQG